ncbi:hypothetical protein [Haloglycomyces albus]|uniref:hypothetical protein n=1 Tax=Haloglycomyces albus TaxID=526067 RepID=UPI00046D1E4F|nr:hypothetical protein [Haloglycomyces albus]
MSSVDDSYRLIVQRLDGTRREHTDRVEAAHRQRDDQAERSRDVAVAAEESLGTAEALRQAARVSAEAERPVPPPRDDLAIVETDMRRATEALEEAKYLAHRPRLLPRWRSDERNAVVYGVVALVFLVVQLAVIRSWTGDGLVSLLLLLGILVAFPLAGFIAGWLAIGVTSRPRLGEGEKLEKNPRLGWAIAASTLVVAVYAAFS